MRVFEPAPGILAFYDGRVTGKRLWSDAPNWLDDGAYSLGTAVYVLIDGAQALVYDSAMSLAHARAIRAEIERRGVRDIRVLLSHHHNDHIAGSAAFAGCEIIAGHKTAEAMQRAAPGLAQDTPPIDPLVMPDTVIDGEGRLQVGQREVLLRPLDIHSHDGLALWLPDTETLLAGDALEDTVTYVAEPDRLPHHLGDLARLETWGARRILPNHGDPGRIAGGGYDASLIGATARYVRHLLACRDDPGQAARPLRDVIAPDLASGALIYFPEYEAVHARNVAVLTAA